MSEIKTEKELAYASLYKTYGRPGQTYSYREVAELDNGVIVVEMSAWGGESLVGIKNNPDYRVGNGYLFLNRNKLPEGEFISELLAV